MFRYKPPPRQVEEDDEEIGPPRYRSIIRLFGIAVVVAFALLAFQLYQIQVVRWDFYRQAADTNRFRLLSTAAPRGVIYDRNGKILVHNEPSFNVSLIPADLPSSRQDEILKKLATMINASLDTSLESESPDALGSLANDVSRTFVSPTRKPGLRELVTSGRRSDPYAPVLLKTDVPREIAFVLQERAQEFPGLRVEIDPIRNYPEGGLTAHLLGYVGHIPREQYDAYQARGYGPTDQVGLTGLELTYEDQLRGQQGQRHVEVDAAGNEVGVIGEDQPRPGNNVYLALDLELQRKSEAALKKGLDAAKATQGAAIALDPNNGEILAFVSLPAYNNNLFAHGIKATDYQALSQDPLHPLVDHAISGQYPPGSTFKLVSASAALQEGVIDDRTTIFDPGAILLPNKYFPDDPKLAQPFFCWFRPGHGALAIREGIAQSCDTFFYKLDGGFSDFTTPLGQTLASDYAKLFGYGALTGIDLPGEAPGLVPDPTWKRKTLNEAWVTGDTYNMAIGQGFVLSTPLQVVNMTATIANGGTVYRPHLGRQIVNAARTLTNTVAPQIIRKLPVEQKNLQIVREGMRGAVTHGTSWKTNLAQVEVAGKTGTAEFFGPRIDGNLPTHAWFTAFAPYDKPKIAVVVFVAGGGEGSEVAVPVAAEILKAFFNIPLDAPLAKPIAPPPPPEARQPKANSPASAPPQQVQQAQPQPQTQPQPQPVAHRFVGQLAQVTENNASERPVFVGTVVDSAGRGLSGVTLSLDTGNGNGVATATSVDGGTFRFNDIDFHISTRWFVRVIGAGESTGLAIDVAPYKQYRLVFTATSQ